jgi:hypothetical protein
MTSENNTGSSTKVVWKSYELVLFRVAFVFFTLMSIPLSGKYYTMLFSLNWLDLGYRDLTNLGRFSPNFLTIPTESGRWGLASYADYGVLLLIAIVVGLIWTVVDRKRLNYRLLYYWLRVLVRYRVAIGMIEFGLVKVFLIQMPEAPLGTLHTNFGDITAQKLYWLSVGVVPWYEITLGFVEVIAGILLFFRKTTMPGALLTAGASANIVYINFAYDGGVHVYSSYFVILCLFLLIPYIADFYKLLVKEQAVNPVRYYPRFKSPAQKAIRFIFKGGIIFLFTAVIGYLHIRNQLHKPLIKEPITAGIPGTKGYYEVSEFKLNNKIIPYSPLDSVRWQDVTFEKYSTITFKVNEAIKLDLSNGVPAKTDLERTWELTGIAGGRQYYYYETDEANQLLKLFNKHPAGEKGKGKKDKAPEKKPDFVLHMERPTASRIILKGINKKNDSLFVQLDKIDKQYALRN